MTELRFLRTFLILYKISVIITTSNKTCIDNHIYDNEIKSTSPTLFQTCRTFIELSPILEWQVSIKEWKICGRSKYNTSPYSSYISILITLSGDVHQHPGPINNPCSICSKPVKNNQVALQCSECGVWVHIKCDEISKDDYKKIKNIHSLVFECPNCRLLTFTGSLFLDNSIWSTSNSFEALSDVDPDITVLLNLSSTKDMRDQSCVNCAPPYPISSTPRKNFIQHTDINLTHIKHSKDIFSDSDPITSHSNTSSHIDSVITEPESTLLSTSSVSNSLITTESTTPATTVDQFSCVIINFQSVRNKYTELHNIITCMNPDVIIGDETHLQPDILNSEILPYGIPNEHKYKIFRKDRRTLCDKGGGGVMVMVKPEYECEECPELDTECEIKWVDITTSKKDKLLVGAFYREPKSPIETLDYLNNSLRTISSSKKYQNHKILLGGDFNLGDIDWTTGITPTGARDKSHCDKLCNILNEHGLEQINRTATRQDRLLDLIITSHPTLIQKCYTCPPVGLSDHDILAVITLLRATPQKKASRTVYNYKKADWNKIHEELSLAKDTFLTSCSVRSVEENWNAFKNSLLKAIASYIPKKQLKKKIDVPWMNYDIKRLIRKKHRLYNRTKKYNNSETIEKFKDLRRKVRNKIHAAYHNYLNNMLDPDTDTTSKTFWKYIKARKQDTMNIGTLKANGKIADSPKQKADMLNNQFTSVFTVDASPTAPDKGTSPYHPMENININIKGVEKCINRLNEKKATGPDKIPISVLKKNSDVIAPVLSIIYQQSIDSGDVPTDWKNANVVPIFKKGDRSKPENYRPVSLTAVASKMMEHIVVSQIMDHLDGQNILHENQHGFRAKRSCESQLIMTTDDIAKHLDNKHQVDMAILDFSKAFDKVSHLYLSEKLRYYGIQGTTRRWVDSFLSNRFQQVVVDNASSEKTRVTSGVPQGSVLGPTLFLLYINDIANNISSTIRLFADDCVIYRPIQSIEDNVLLQKDLDRLVQWGDTWCMEFNIKKCAIMQFTTTHKKKHYSYYMKGQQLECVQNHPYLGVELSDNMKFTQHISNISKKASSVLGFLKRNLKHCPQKIKERAYTSLVRPKLEYASTVWNPQQSIQIKQLEQIQRNAARFVYNRPFNPNKLDSVSTMITNLNWTSLQQRRIYADLILMYKAINGLVAIPVIYHPTPAVVISTRHSHAATFIPYQCRLNFYMNSFFPRTVHYWNRLPESVATASCVDVFKSAIQQEPGATRF